MTILIALLLLAMPGITFTVAQEGTVPKETCQILMYDFIHEFTTNPNVDISTLPGPSRAELEQLKGNITSKQKCSIVADIRVFNITHDNKPVRDFPTITETIKIQVSATTDIKDPTTRIRELDLCLEDVQVTAADLKIPLNGPNGEIKAVVTTTNVGRQTCCHAIYGFTVDVTQCCRPGLLEDGDNCSCDEGKFLNLNKTSCDDCPEDTYQPNRRSSSCLRCPNGTTTYGRTGTSSRSFCLKACEAGERYNMMSKKCETCPKNTYQQKKGQTVCIACQPNSVTKYTGSKMLEDCVESCEQGSFYSFKIGGCELCPWNSFQEKEGQFNCTPCETKRITLSTGSMLQEDCIMNCSHGTFFNRTAQECQDCPLNTYQPMSGTSQCVQCPDAGITVNTSSKMLGDCIKNCSAGSSYNFTIKDCENCPLNYYQPKAGQTACIKCPNGKITVNVSTATEDDCIEECSPGYRYNRELLACFRCELNTYKPTKGETECIACPNGTVTYKLEPNINITDCGEECDRGYYFNITAWRCEKCPRNTTQENRGQKDCMKCPFDRPITEREGSVGETNCIGICEAGKFYNKDLRGCEPCRKNFYQPNSGTSQCLKCNDSHITFEEGSTNMRQCVKACLPGSHHIDRTARCKLCSNDSHQSERGKEECERCWEGKMTLQEGSTRMEDCLPVCMPGEYLNNLTGNCELCPRNKYQPLGRQFRCENCPEGSLSQRNGSTSQQDCLFDCEKGYFHNRTSNKCSPCPIGKYKDSTGHMECYACNSDRTTLNEGSAHRTDCILVCFEGNYFNRTSDNCMECPMNTYQNNTTSIFCSSCPNNGITKGTGAKSMDDCITPVPNDAQNQDRHEEIIIPVVLGVVVLSVCLLGIVFYRRWRMKENERRMSGRPLDPRGRRSVNYEGQERPKLDSVASMPNHHYKMAGSGLQPDVQRPSVRIANIPNELEIPRENLNFLGQVLGKGNFGKVEKAILVKDGMEIVVAVKMIKGGGTFSDEKELFDELEMLASLYPHPHPNIVNLIGGSTTSDGPLFVVVEYCGEGNLLKHLQKNQIQARPKQEYVNIFPKAQKPGIQYAWKLQKALEICNGMAHLAKFKIIHRDVAARNVLLDENWVAKISDFGMARDIYVKQIYRKDTEGFLPVRWMAIESLESFIYTTQSDVWSFGILLWEIISDGRVPYNNILDHTQLLNYIKSGRIMKRPKNCPKDFYHIMEKCWATNPADRPLFETLIDAIEVLYEDEMHKDDALPQRIRRKFSSRRKKRKQDEHDVDAGGKTRAHKTLSNTSGKKIDKIEEEPTPNTEKKLEEDAIKMELLETRKKENANNEFDNKGYVRTGSSTSDEHDVGTEGSQKNDKTPGLDTISELPLSGQPEQIQETSDDAANASRNRTLVDIAGEEPAPILQTDLENQVRQPKASGEAELDHL